MDVTANIEFEWLNHTNTTWSLKDCDNVANRDLVQSMYDLLIQHKEVRVMSSTPSHVNDVQMLPHFQYENTSNSDIHYYISTLLVSQFESARYLCSSSQFAISLKQRLLILKRIYYALMKKFYDKKKCKRLPTKANNAGNVIRESMPGSQALLEIGVKTGLSLLFSLLKQNWQVSGILKVPSLCNSVLETSLELLQKLPPLCLSNDIQLTDLGITSLEQVSDFLRDSVLNSPMADAQGKLLSSKLLLQLAIQRGSLRYLLYWIEVALDASCKSDVIKDPYFKNIITELLSGKFKSKLHEWKNQNFEASLYETVLILMEILVSLTEGLGDAPTGVESESSTNIAYFEKPDVFVWGSNAAHQLAEENLEKFAVPHKSTMFTDVQEVGLAF